MRFSTGSAGEIRHGITVVDDKDMQACSPAKAGGRSAVATHGPCQGNAKHAQQQAAHRQQKPLLEAHAAAVFAHCAEQKFHRRPVHRAITPAVENVDDDGNARQRQAGDCECGGEESEGEWSQHRL